MTTTPIKTMTIIADGNISHINDYFNPDVLGVPVSVVTMTGRDITASILHKYQPQALLVRSVTEVNEHLLANNDSVKFIGSATIGTDHIDQTYLASRNINFTNASGCSKHSVAQYVLTAIFSLLPSLQKKSYSQKKGLTQKNRLTVGIIGLGNIGSTLARYVEEAHDLHWKILGYDPLLPKDSMNNASFDEVLSQSDVISIHVPLTTAETSEYPSYHLIDQRALSKMKPTALLINSARGQVVQESALLVDIEKTRRQVVLDVFEHEPVVSHQLLDRLAIATPHIAGYTLEGKLRGTQMVYEAFCQQFGLTVAQNLDNLLPNNPYQWKSLLESLTLAHPKSNVNKGEEFPSLLTTYYNLKIDDSLLRQSVNLKYGKVEGAVFDGLRKHYPLRREWRY